MPALPTSARRFSSAGLGKYSGQNLTPAPAEFTVIVLVASRPAYAVARIDDLRENRYPDRVVIPVLLILAALSLLVATDPAHPGE